MATYLFLRDGHPTWFLLTCIFLGLGAWTKNEGLIWAIIGILILIVYAPTRKLRLLGTGIVLGTVAPWLGFKTFINLESDLMSSTGISTVLDGISRIPLILTAFVKTMTLSGLYGLTWPLLAWALARNWRHLLSRPMVGCGLLLVAQLFIYVAGYMVTPYDLQWHLETSVDRLILHLTPFALWLASVNAYQIIEARQVAHLKA